MAASGLNSYDAIIRQLNGASAHIGHGVVVLQTQLTLNEVVVPVFFKRYFEPEASLRFLGRVSKARRETRSYDTFASIDIRCPQWVACGEDRDAMGRLRSAFIITVAVPGAMMLDQYIRKYCAEKTCHRVQQTRRRLIEQLAAQVRNAHEQGFFHNDLHWRNIIINGPEDEPLVWWIDCPRGRFRRRSILKHHFRIKDLACLDRTAIELCTRRERLRFLVRYLGRGKSLLRRFARDVDAYRKRRW